MKKIITLALFLAVVAGLAGGALSFVNGITAPIIQEAAIAAEKERELFFGYRYAARTSQDVNGADDGI